MTNKRDKADSDEVFIPEEEAPRRVPVTLVRVDGKSALVEWSTPRGLRRGYIPASALKEQRDVLDGVLESSIPYGVPWERYEPRAITGDEVAAALRANGIWTQADYNARLREVQGILVGLLGATLAELARFAALQSKED